MTPPIPLSLANLDRLSPETGRPAYAREALSAGILHFGIGNFHRAHQAMYLDELMTRNEAYDWAIVGAGVFEGERVMRSALSRQDWLTTLVEQSAGTNGARVLGSMIDFMEPGDAETTVMRMARPDIRIVSLTVTEGGYFLDNADHFDAAHPAIIADARTPDAPKTAFGMILKALRLRRDAGIGPFTVMSCDNIPHNGRVARNTLTGLARLFDPAFAEWVGAKVAFPNSMVDRITPATTDRERGIVAEKYGIADAAPVFCEDFTQWVLEDNFPLGRPPFEKVGAQFVDHVAPFELMKLRILNGGHAAIAYPAGLLDIHFVHEAMEHPLIRAFLQKLTTEEFIPTVPPVPNTALDDYAGLIEQRFANPKIGDTIRRLCFDGTNRQPKFILPTLRDVLVGDGKVDGLALESALWCRYCAGTTDSGATIEPNDPDWPQLTTIAQSARERPLAWLEMDAVYGRLAQEKRFTDRFAHWLTALWRDGTDATLRAYLAGP